MNKEKWIFFIYTILYLSYCLGLLSYSPYFFSKTGLSGELLLEDMGSGLLLELSYALPGLTLIMFGYGAYFIILIGLYAYLLFFPKLKPSNFANKVCSLIMLLFSFSYLISFVSGDTSFAGGGIIFGFISHVINIIFGIFGELIFLLMLVWLGMMLFFERSIREQIRSYKEVLKLKRVKVFNKLFSLIVKLLNIGYVKGQRNIFTKSDKDTKVRGRKIKLAKRVKAKKSKPPFISKVFIGGGGMGEDVGYRESGFAQDFIYMAKDFVKTLETGLSVAREDILGAADFKKIICELTGYESDEVGLEVKGLEYEVLEVEGFGELERGGYIYEDEGIESAEDIKNKTVLDSTNLELEETVELEGQKVSALCQRVEDAKLVESKNSKEERGFILVKADADVDVGTGGLRGLKTDGEYNGGTWDCKALVTIGARGLEVIDKAARGYGGDEEVGKAGKAGKGEEGEEGEEGGLFVRVGGEDGEGDKEIKGVVSSTSVLDNGFRIGYDNVVGFRGSGINLFVGDGGGIESVSHEKSLYVSETDSVSEGDVEGDSIEGEVIKKLESTLNDFGISAKVVGISRGPVITRYEILPAAGTRLSKISNIQDNIALTLASLRIRVLAPIPGKSLVGIEVPNEIRKKVYFGDLVCASGFEQSDAKLPIALGKGIEGDVVVADLSSMPHLLIAGATGSGKSVFVNTLICSLLYATGPKRARFLLIDPKRVELSIYNNLPSLIAPVITHPKKALVALSWVVDEMERRYGLLEKYGVRDISSFNEKVVSMRKSGYVTDSAFEYIVVIIDEFADLMMTSGKEVELKISRLAAMSRAVGIHLVVATQRPSVDVITGLIKANFPARIAFQVSSKTESRIILDTNGAEKLLGKGDLLFLAPGFSGTIRIQGAFLQEKEILNFISNIDGATNYIDELENIIINEEEDGASLAGGTGEFGIKDEPLYIEAVEIVKFERKASASYLQRKMRIGYNRAARIIELMEAEGIVGTQKDGSKVREVLI